MVQIENTRKDTVNGLDGTVYTVLVNFPRERGARAIARGALVGRFPVNVGRVSVTGVEEVEGEFTGLSSYKVDVFVPFNNPSNPERIY